MRILILAFCSGSVVTVWLSVLPGKVLSGIFLLFPAILWLVQYVTKKYVLFFRICMVTGFFLAGVGMSVLRHHGAIHVIPPLWEKGVIHVEGTITGLPLHEKGLWRFQLSGLTVRDKPLKGNLRLSWYGWHRKLMAGQRWSLYVKLSRPHGAVNPGSFELESWLRQNHITGTGYVVRELPADYLGISTANIDYWRDRLGQYIAHLLPGQDISLLQGLLLGRKKAISQEDWELFNHTGTTHLLVISGLHIGLMFLAGYTLIRLLKTLRILPLRRVALPRMGVISGLFFSFLYALVAGFSIPVQRALTMLVCGCVGRLFDFAPKASTIWLLAMATVLVIEPLSALGSGFWYSFVAVASLLFFLGNRSGQWPWWKKWWLPQWSVFVALFPWMLWYQQSSTFYSPLINMVSIPFVGLIVVPLLFLGTGIALVSGSAWVLCLANRLINGWCDALRQVSSWTESAMIPGQGIEGSMTFVLCMIGAICILLPKGLGLRMLLFPCLFLVWFSKVKEVPVNQAEITLLDVKKSQVALVRTHRHVLVYDMGDRTSHQYFNTTRSALLPFLRQNQIKEVDVWMLPRGLSGGIAGLQFQQAVTVKKVFSPERKSRPDFSRCDTPSSWQWDGVSFSLIPDKGTCMLKVESGTRSALFTGTLSSSKADALVIKSPALLRSDVWFVFSLFPYLSENHKLIETISPAYIALSESSLTKAEKQKIMMGKNSSFNAGKNSVVATADTGAQYYQLRASGVSTSFMRKSQRYWWRY